MTDDLEPGKQPGASPELESRYRAYLAALNERRLDDLVEHVHDELTYNGEPMTRRQYQELIAADLAAAPDLVYDAQIVVAANDAAGGQVACRLTFDCTPRGELLGFRPDGARLRFAEHVFYRYQDGRIAAVRSMIDRAAIAEQLSGRDVSALLEPG
ncbi:ester cyclase [Promicromonospora sp. NPDC023987]|uniref:ester cyclase n=1 Tax=Promicromonospora sp. NPDC023987 TaxID=3155360 RepID=UPI0033CBC390